MPDNIDERYASDPVWHQTREAAYVAIQQASRLIAADLPGSVSPSVVATAIFNNIEAVARVAQTHHDWTALESSEGSRSRD